MVSKVETVVGEDDQAEFEVLKFRPRTPNQIQAWAAMKEKQLIILSGSAGVGKTELAVARATDLWKEGKIDNIYLIRPHRHLGADYGATKGNDAEKLLPFVLSMLMKVKKYLGAEVLRNNFILDGFEDLFSEKQGIKIIPVEKCQGLSFRKRDFVIVDEAQNCEVSQIKALVTRPEKCSQMVICGDDTQSALNKENGLEYLLKVWEEKQSLLQNFQGVFRFEVKECQRKGIAAVYTEIFEEEGAWTKSKKVEKKVEPDSLVHKNDEGVQGHLREE